VIKISHLEALRQVISEKPMVVALVSDMDCNVCLAITPELMAMEEHFPEVTFVSLDTKEVPAVAGEHLVFVYPTLILFAEGKETVRYERVFSMLDVEAHIERLADLLFS
jgi:thiol-disulfide isomerase/thioredoxin